MPTPVVKDNDVLVEIHAAGVNQLDSMIKKGEFKLILPYKLPRAWEWITTDIQQDLNNAMSMEHLGH